MAMHRYCIRIAPLARVENRMIVVLSMPINVFIPTITAVNTARTLLTTLGLTAAWF